MPASAFITNAPSRTLKQRLEELILHSKELKFLVGFFYFSGWRELYESLKKSGELSIKLLVGLDVDKTLDGVVETARESGALSGGDIADRFFESLAVALNDEALDTREFHEQVVFFLDLLRDGRLQIRKTLDPTHSKLYVFNIKDELAALAPGGRFITGSSNLTRAGVLAQNEFNVEISDYGTEEAQKYFDDLWETAVPITEIPARKEYLERFIRTRTQAAEVTPFEAYVLVLKTYLDLMEQKTVKPHVRRLLAERGYKEYQYQTDAVSQALTIIDKYNGVIVADVVGLGKSIVACELAYHLGKRGMVICPPGLMGDKKRKDSGWYKYLEDFKLHDWEIRSSGDLANAAEYLRQYGDDIEVVIVDEAHRFRNEDTEDYELLSGICRNRAVILLTATPFNNTPQDIFSLLKLFIIPGKSGITLDENLEARFSVYNADFRRLSYILRYANHPDKEKRMRAEKYYLQMFESGPPIDLIRVKNRASELAARIRAALEPVLIRRNRLDLKRDPVYSKEIIELSEVQDPVELFFELSDEQMDFYDYVIEECFAEDGRFTGAAYQPFMYERRLADEGGALDEESNRTFQQQKNLYEFMRRLLVKRFESSFGAFVKSIRNFECVHERVLEFIENSGGRYVLDRKLIERAYAGDPDEIDSALEEFSRQLLEMKKLPKHQRIYNVPEFARAGEFLADIRSDLALLKEIRKKVEQLDLVSDDPKARCLVSEIKRILRTPPAKGEPKNKIVIFSEYTDTIKHLEPILKNAFPAKVLSSGEGWSSGFLRKVLENFDAGVNLKIQSDDFQILLTSDKLSEGVNLNRAGAIINYDIPWNPTRVIQRIGRINRIGKKVFQNLYIHNFFPTEKGADIVKSREIASQKMFLIHNTLGEDAKIFAVDETPSPSELYKRVNMNPEEEEEESLFTRIRSAFFKIREEFPEIVKRVAEYPNRVKTAKSFSENQLLVFRKKGLAFFIQSVKDTAREIPDIQSMLLEEALPVIRCGEKEPKQPLSGNFWKSYEAIRTFKEVTPVPKSDNSLEMKAFNNLQAALQNCKKEMEEFLPFIRTLIEDLRDYKTLSKSTLRRFSGYMPDPKNQKTIADFTGDLKVVRGILGEDYLEIIKEKAGSIKSVVIIAIENKKIAGNT